MKTIWKFPLLVTDKQSVAMPRRARLVHVADQDGSPTLWAEVDTNADVLTAMRIILIVGTGYPTPDGAEYVGSALCGPFVWHVYDGGEPENRRKVIDSPQA